MCTRRRRQVRARRQRRQRQGTGAWRHLPVIGDLQRENEHCCAGSTCPTCKCPADAARTTSDTKRILASSSRCTSQEDAGLADTPAWLQYLALTLFFSSYS